MIKKGLETIKEFLYPYVCPICREIINFHDGFCVECSKSINFVNVDDTEYSIFDNLKFRSHLDGLISVFYYDDFVRDSMIMSKSYNNNNTGYIQNSDIFINILLNRYKNYNFTRYYDIITFVSTFNSKENHSYNLAKSFSNKNNIQIVNTVKKIKITKKQHLLNSNEREVNIEGVFEFNEDISIEGKRVIVFDDIITTGATVNEFAKILKDNGAIKVLAMSMAVTKDDGGKNGR